MRTSRHTGGSVKGWGILRAVALLVVLGGCAAAPMAAPASPLPVPLQNIVEPMPEPGPDEELLAWVNAARNGAGLQPLRMDPRLYEAALEFAKDAAERPGYCGTRDSLGRGPAARARANGYDPLVYGENVICGCTTPYRAVQAWLRNEAQRAIILDARAVHAGVGWYEGSRCYVVFDVGAERPAPPSPLPTQTSTPEPRRVFMPLVGK